LFSRLLSYENEAFHWMETRVGFDYDAIIEIGANVGVYGVFFDRLSRESGSRLKKIFSFEPAREPYRRLLANLAAKSERVIAYPVAVGAQGGLRHFLNLKTILQMARSIEHSHGFSQR
jgi:FkbM family methyltransferase